MSVETLTEVKEYIEGYIGRKRINNVNVEQCDISCEAKWFAFINELMSVKLNNLQTFFLKYL